MYSIMDRHSKPAWLLAQCMKPKTTPEDILTEEAMGLLAERLITPLQIEHYLTLALEQAYRLGEKPVTAQIESEPTVLHGLGKTANA